MLAPHSSHLWSDSSSSESSRSRLRFDAIVSPRAVEFRHNFHLPSFHENPPVFTSFYEFLFWKLADSRGN